MSSDKTDRISRRAYELWEAAGRPHGQHDDHWLAAEREMSEGVTDTGALAADAAATDGAAPNGNAPDGAATATDPHPGMMGDGTEEQNLDQPGNPAARITEDEVRDAFSGDADQKG